MLDTGDWSKSKRERSPSGREEGDPTKLIIPAARAHPVYRGPGGAARGRPSACRQPHRRRKSTCSRWCVRASRRTQWTRWPARLGRTHRHQGGEQSRWRCWRPVPPQPAALIAPSGAGVASHTRPSATACHSLTPRTAAVHGTRMLWTEKALRAQDTKTEDEPHTPRVHCG
jgi:hypothetical protein